MGKKLLTTPRSKVKGAIRRIFLGSRERGAALKRDGYACVTCGAKRTEVRVEVHHMDGAGINEIVDLIYKKLLCSPERLTTFCVGCHEDEDGRSGNDKKAAT